MASNEFMEAQMAHTAIPFRHHYAKSERYHKTVMYRSCQYSLTKNVSWTDSERLNISNGHV